MHTLILMRHAKSDYPPGVDDRQRPLSARGERDAEAAGRWMHMMYPRIDVVLVSPAVRAQQTWSRVEDHLDSGQVRMEPMIYEDWGSGLSQLIATTLGPTVQLTLVVGHNPGIEDLARRWSCEDSSGDRARMMKKFPTCGIAVLTLESGWVGPGALQTFTVPRG